VPAAVLAAHLWVDPQTNQLLLLLLLLLLTQQIRLCCQQVNFMSASCGTCSTPVG
jgi:hypothetical protein